jgi:hypothetical protein
MFTACSAIAVSVALRSQFFRMKRSFCSMAQILVAAQFFSFLTPPFQFPPEMRSDRALRVAIPGIRVMRHAKRRDEARPNIARFHAIRL